MKYGFLFVGVLIVALVAGCIGQNAPTGSLVVKGEDILEFYGAECPHCQAMEPVVAQVEKDLSITITKYEVWHDDDNRAKFTEYNDIVAPACGGGLGVPAFVNLRTEKAICGEKSASELKGFITG